MKFLVDAQLPTRLGRFLADAAAPPNPDTALRLQSPEAVITPGRPLDTTTVDHPVAAGALARLAPGWWVDGAPSTEGSIAFGEDLLWTGSFEDMDTDPRPRAPTPGR